MPRPVGFRGRFAQFVVDLFTKHPVAKVFALVLGSIVFVLIDRELRSELLSPGRKLLITAQRQGDTGDLIILRLPSGYLLHSPNSDPPVARARIVGLRKDRALAQPPFNATIPSERIANTFGDSSEGFVALEKGDIEFPPLANATFEFESVNLFLAREETKEIELKARPTRPIPQGHELKVEFKPSTLRLVGAKSELDKLDEPLSVDVEFDANESQAVLQPAKVELAPDLRQRGIRRADGQLDVSYRAWVQPINYATLESSLRIRVVVNPEYPYEYQFVPPNDLGEIVGVRLEGAAADVQRAEEDARLKDLLVVHVWTERKVEQNKSMIDELPEGKWSEELRADARIPQELLDRFNLRLQKPIEPVPFKARKRVRRQELSEDR